MSSSAWGAGACIPGRWPASRGPSHCFVFPTSAFRSGRAAGVLSSQPRAAAPPHCPRTPCPKPLGLGPALLECARASCRGHVVGAGNERLSSPHAVTLFWATFASILGAPLCPRLPGPPLLPQPRPPGAGMRELPSWHSFPLALHLLGRRGRACSSFSPGHCLCHLEKREPPRLGRRLPGLDKIGRAHV